MDSQNWWRSTDGTFQGFTVFADTAVHKGMCKRVLQHLTEDGMMSELARHGLHGRRRPGGKATGSHSDARDFQVGQKQDRSSTWGSVTCRNFPRISSSFTVFF